METTKVIDQCPTCAHAMWKELPHRCGPREPVLTTHRYFSGYLEDWGLRTHTDEFYAVRANARREVERLRQKYSAQRILDKKWNRPVCRCKECKQTPHYHIVRIENGVRKRYKNNAQTNLERGQS